MTMLEISNSVTVSQLPNRPNTMYDVRDRTNPNTDFADLLSTLRERVISTPGYPSGDSATGSQLTALSST